MTTTTTIVLDTSSNPPTIDHVHTSDHRLVFVTYSRPTHTQPSEEPLSKRSGFRRQYGVGLQRGYVGIGNHENEQVTSVIFLLNSQHVSISGTKDRKKRILVN